MQSRPPPVPQGGMEIRYQDTRVERSRAQGAGRIPLLFSLTVMVLEAFSAVEEPLILI